MYQNGTEIEEIFSLFLVDLSRQSLQIEFFRLDVDATRGKSAFVFCPEHLNIPKYKLKRSVVAILNDLERVVEGEHLEGLVDEIKSMESVDGIPQADHHGGLKDIHLWMSS